MVCTERQNMKIEDRKRKTKLRSGDTINIRLPDGNIGFMRAGKRIFMGHPVKDDRMQILDPHEHDSGIGTNTAFNIALIIAECTGLKITKVDINKGHSVIFTLG